MTRTQLQFRVLLPALATACVMAISPTYANAGQDNQKPVQPTPGKAPVVVEQVENGPAFGAEVKYTKINDRDAVLLGGYAGAVYDNKLLIGGGGYWQVNDDYHFGMGYGGLVAEWYALRTPAVSLSVRGLIGGGVSTVSWGGYPVPQLSFGRHGSPIETRPPMGTSGGYYLVDQGFFIAEPQLNITLRVAHGVAVVGGVGYRVIGAANGFEDQLQGITGSVAIRFGVGK